MKAPKYFSENRYTSILVPTEESGYEIDNAETTFERKINRELVAANRLLRNNEFSKAIDKYLHLRATITTFLRPQLSVAAAQELTWTRESYRAVTESLIDRSAHLLRATPVTRTSMPDAFVAHPPKLPDTLTRALKPVEQFGLRDDEAKLDAYLSTLSDQLEKKHFSGAEKTLTEALQDTEDKELLGALQHDLAILQERNGNRDKAIQSMQKANEIFATIARPDLQALTLDSLAGVEYRKGDKREAKKSEKKAEKLRQDKHLFSISGFGRASSSFGLSSNTNRLRLVSNGVSSSIGPRLTTTTSLPGVRNNSEEADEPSEYSARLITHRIYAERQPKKNFVLLSEGQPLNIDINQDGTGVRQFYKNLATTTDLELLMGYFKTPVYTVAYLTHIFNWVLPLNLGTAYAEIGDYEKAEQEYLKAGDYQYMNQSVGTVNLWIQLAELYLNWGDERYRSARRDVSRFADAAEKYALILGLDNTLPDDSPLYADGNLGRMRARVLQLVRDLFVDERVVAENPRIVLVLRRARMQLYKINNHLDYLGLGVYFPPFSFEYLQTVARYFAQHAAQVEQRFIQYRSTAENEQLREQQMEQQVSVAEASVQLELKGLDEAGEAVDIARANQNYAQRQLTNAQQARDDFNRVRWDLMNLDQITAWASASAVDRDDQVSLTINWSIYSADSKRRNVVLQELTAKKTRITHDLEAARLAREVASASSYLEVTRQQLQQAQARVEIARQRIAIATMQFQYAKENAAFLSGREFSSRMWYQLSRTLRSISRRYLDRAVEISVLMEKAYEAETGRDLRKIKFVYGISESVDYLGADQLLQDIDYFTVDYVRTKSKRAQLKQSFSIADQFPGAFHSLQTTGNAFFETALSHFDHTYPGFYLQKIKQVEVLFIGLSGTEGLHGTLRNIGTSKFRQQNGNIVDIMYAADVMPLSEYNVRQDAIVFQSDPKELRLFENSGVATMWQLELPRPVNSFDLRQVLDIRLVIYYDAFFDAGLEESLKQQRPTSGNASKLLGLRMVAPDELYFLRTQHEAVLRLDASLFPTNQIDQVLRSYRVHAAGDPATIDSLTINVTFTSVDASHTFTLSQDGTAEGSVFTDPIDQPLFGDVHFRVLAEDNPQLMVDGKLDLSGLQDIALLFEYDYDLLT